MAGLLMVVALVVTLSSLASSQGRRTIAHPDFPCGKPYGPNGELPDTGRVKRQIIFPDEPKYQHYLQFLLDGDLGRQGENTDDTADEKPFCGATPISDQFILTAAHCVVDFGDRLPQLTLGDIDRTVEGEENSRAATYQISEVFVHPDYSHEKPTRYHDVALLKMETKIQFNDAVYPYCISDQIPEPGTIVVISGYGYYNATYQPDHLLEANVTVMDTAECEDVFKREDLEASLRLRYPNLLQGTDILCAISDESDACQGDSGGPVLREKDGKIFMEGIVSGGADCHGNFKSVLPGLYISIAKQIDFIDEHMFGPSSAVP